MKNIEDQITTSFRALRKESGAYFALGVTLFLSGCYAIFAGTGLTSAAVVGIASILIVAGVTQVIGAFSVLDAAKNIFLALLAGMLDVIVGLVLLKDPAMGASAVATQLAMLFMFGGVYRFAVAGLLQFPQYGWFAFSGALSVILGAMLWTQWPTSAPWFIGLAVGLNFIFAGIAWSALGWRLKAV